jgi:hypothetical protein
MEFVFVCFIHYLWEYRKKTIVHDSFLKEIVVTNVENYFLKFFKLDAKCLANL